MEILEKIKKIKTWNKIKTNIYNRSWHIFSTIESDEILYLHIDYNNSIRKWHYGTHPEGFSHPTLEWLINKLYDFYLLYHDDIYPSNN